MSYLLIDIGNTFLKWGTYSPPSSAGRSLAQDKQLALSPSYRVPHCGQSLALTRRPPESGMTAEPSLGRS